MCFTFSWFWGSPAGATASGVKFTVSCFTSFFKYKDLKLLTPKCSGFSKLVSEHTASRYMTPTTQDPPVPIQAWPHPTPHGRGCSWQLPCTWEPFHRLDTFLGSRGDLTVSLLGPLASSGYRLQGAECNSRPSSLRDLHSTRPGCPDPRV